jgi:hypothetical protein
MTDIERSAILKAPFTEADIEWKIQTCGGGRDGQRIWALCVCYVSNRAIMQRLDDAFGPDGWENLLAAGPAGGVICGLKCRWESGWTIRWDGAENTDIEGVKGGISNSMKRAAVHYGIGRYLYLLEASYAVIHDKGAYKGKVKEKNKDDIHFRWDPPSINGNQASKPTSTSASSTKPAVTGDRELPVTATTMAEAMELYKQANAIKPLSEQWHSWIADVDIKNEGDVKNGIERLKAIIAKGAK